MAMAKLLIRIPQAIKTKLDAMRAEGYTASGYIRKVLEQDLDAREAAGLLKVTNKKKGR